MNIFGYIVEVFGEIAAHFPFGNKNKNKKSGSWLLPIVLIVIFISLIALIATSF